MLAKRFKLTDADISDAQRENLKTFRRLVVEKGYSIFPANPTLCHHPELDMVVLANRTLQTVSQPVLVYPGRDGSIRIRGLKGASNKILYSDIRKVLPPKILTRLKLRQARWPLKAGWKDLFSPESFEAAKLQDIGI